MLGGTSFNDVMNIVKQATPNYSDFIQEDFTEYSKEVMPFHDLTKEASHTGVINPTSALYTACTDLEYNGDRYSKVLGAAAHYEDSYLELQKEAAGIGSGIKNLAVGAAQMGGGVVKAAIQALSKPALILGGVGLGLTY
ncbi:hypothetical protein H8D85_01630 [bacterium]|nr:hypothetical protein [bacterium]